MWIKVNSIDDIPKINSVVAYTDEEPHDINNLFFIGWIFELVW